jgi:hypothetical protein
MSATVFFQLCTRIMILLQMPRFWHILLHLLSSCYYARGDSGSCMMGGLKYLKQHITRTGCSNRAVPLSLDPSMHSLNLFVCTVSLLIPTSMSKAPALERQLPAMPFCDIMPSNSCNDLDYLVCVATTDQVTINRDNGIFLDNRQIFGTHFLYRFKSFGRRLSSKAPRNVSMCAP